VLARRRGTEQTRPPDTQSYASALEAAFGDRPQPGWVDFSGTMLYAAQHG